jgi:hypothetical protein
MNLSNIPLGTPTNALFGVEFDVVLLEFREGFFEVSHELVSLFGLDYDVVHVSLDGLSDEIAETFEHTLLVCCSCVLQTEWHANVAMQFKRHDEISCELVRLFHRFLIVARIHIKEAEGFAPQGRADYLIYAW